MKISKELLKILGIIFLLAIVIPFFINLGLFLTDIIAGKDIKFLEILYSNVGNEGWVSFWGSFSAGLLAFVLIFHYQKQLSAQRQQHEEQLVMQRQQHEEQLEWQYKQQKQQILYNKIFFDKDIIKKVLKSWDNIIFDELYDIIIHSYIHRYASQAPVKDEVSKKFLQEKNKLIGVINLGMLEIDLLDLRINSNKTKNNFYKAKSNVYTSFKNLHDHLNNILSFLETEKENINSPYSKEKYDNFNLQFDQKIEEYSSFFTETINSTTEYFYIYEQYAIECEFDALYDDAFFEGKQTKN